MLALRNKYKIRKSMINNKRISQTEHLNWFINLSKSNFFHNYAFINRNKIIGSGYGSNYNVKSKYYYWESIETLIYLKIKNMVVYYYFCF